MGRTLKLILMADLIHAWGEGGVSENGQRGNLKRASRSAQIGRAHV